MPKIDLSGIFANSLIRPKGEKFTSLNGEVIYWDGKGPYVAQNQPWFDGSDGWIFNIKGLNGAFRVDDFVLAEEHVA